MKFYKAANIQESMTNPQALKLVGQAVKAVGKGASYDKIINYIKNELVKHPENIDKNLEHYKGAIEAYKKGKV